MQEDAAAVDTFPMGQSKQKPALLLLYFPPGQLVQDSAPIDENVPASHSLHVDAPRPAYVPGVQLDAQSAERSQLNLPTGQLSHASRFGVLFLPLLHSPQEEAPVGEYSPPAQSVHESAPLLLNLPAAHRSHDTPKDACLPASQGKQEGAPAGLISPIGQVVLQAAAPTPLKEPAGQAWQVLSASYCPARQGVQASAPVKDTKPGKQVVQAEAEE